MPSVSALIFPQTALRRGVLTALWPLFRPIMVLEPAGLSAGPAASQRLVEADVVRILRPAADPAAQGAQARELDRLLAQWEAWAADHRGSGQAEALKAGLSLPDPDRESLRQLRQDIRAPQPQAAAPGPDAPGLTDDLFLRLMHLKDLEAADMDELMAKVDAGQENLGRVMGLEEEDAEPTDYEQPLWQKLPPLDYALAGDRHLERRLRAWAGLARRSDLGEAWLTTADLETAHLLMEMANRRYAPPEQPGLPLGPQTGPSPDSPLAQEAARLLLPDLSHLSEEEFLELREALGQHATIHQMRQSLYNLLQRLTRERWSAKLAEECQAGARMLAASFQTHLEAAGVATGPQPRVLSVLVFPGYKREHLLSLMAGQEPQGLPEPSAWPQTWPRGSWPVLALWS